MNPQHLPLLKGYKIVCQAVGNGSCGTNRGPIHIIEDNSSENASIEMKKKITQINIWQNVYVNVIGLP